ncbi:MAG TPA: hypothetical protein PK637_13335 [Flavobacteriales bacterium]|nr:hypothetical protein [Flavobacteriales bacterium]HRJ39376.1 hypothetical protein [Flavobacteriales bacterium]
MTPALAQEYIKRRMHELGFGDNYHIRLKHFIIRQGETRVEKAYNSFYILVEEPARLQIKSQNGFFELANTNANEMQYEHHGKITIRHTGGAIARVRFIQVIPYK